MRRWIAPLMLGFGITMAVIIGKRMSTDAMAVVIGVVVGVAASVPTSLLLAALMRRDRRAWQTEPPAISQPTYQAPLPQQPPIIMVSPSDIGQRSTPQTYMPPPPLTEDGGLRRLRVVGNDDDWMA